jgi:uncharacterized membrane protein
MVGMVPARRSPLVLSAFMVGAGLMHFVVPDSYARIVPRALGHARFLVAATGVAEVAAGALLVSPRTRRAGAWFSLAILVGVFPANVQMALDGGISGHGFPLGSPVVAWLRLPLQAPLIVWAWRNAGRSEAGPNEAGPARVNR